MASSRQNIEEFVGLQRVDHFVSLERRRDREANRTSSVPVETDYTNHTGRSHLRPRSHISHDGETRNLRLEIDDLRNKLRHKEHIRGNRKPLSNLGTNSKEDHTYRQRCRTLPSESFSAFSRLDR